MVDSKLAAQPSAQPKLAPRPEVQPVLTVAQVVPTAGQRTFVISELPSGETSEHWFKALFHGDFGVGKTCLAASAYDVPSMRDVLYVNAEAGNLSIRHYSGLVDQARATNYHTFARVHEFLRLHCRYRDEGDRDKLAELESTLKGRPIPADRVRMYRTVVVDSLTEVQKFCMYQLLGITVGSAKLDLQPNAPEWKEWGTNAEMIRLLVRTFRDLPMNVIFVCPSMDVENDKKQMIKKPMLPGKLSGEIQGFLDVVGYYAVFQLPGADKETPSVHRLYLSPGMTFQAKNRLGGKTTYVDITDERSGMKQLIALIASSGEAQSSAVPSTSTPIKPTKG